MMRTRIEPWLTKQMFGALWLGVFLLVGCQQQMALQPSFKPLDTCDFFPDNRSERPLVPGTVARGHLRTDTALFTGRRPPKDQTQGQAEASRAAAEPGTAKPSTAATATQEQDENFIDEFPFPITKQVLEHGYHRYMIYCVVCHDPLGTGNGKIVERGYTPPPSYHIPRLRKAPVGRFFAVMSEGYGSMPSYGAQIPVRDRWAIAAYIRALQLSQHFPAEDLSKAKREGSPPPAAPAGEKSP